MNEPNTLTEEFERLLQDKPAQIDFLAVFSDSMGSENWALLFGADKHTMKSKYHNGGTGIPIKFIDWLDPLFEETHYLAKEYIDDNVLDDEPDWPGAYLAARIVFIAAAHDAEIGQEIYRNLLADEPEGDDPSEVHNKSRAEKHFEYPLHLVDHRDLEEAFCQMIGIDPKIIEIEGDIDETKFDALLVAVNHVAQPILDLDVGKRNRAIKAASPWMVSAMWQCFPKIHWDIRIAVPWISSV